MASAPVRRATSARPSLLRSDREFRRPTSIRVIATLVLFAAWELRRPATATFRR